MAPKDKTPEDARQRKLDKKLDDGLEATFPASDPVAITEPAATLPDDGLETEGKEKKTDKSA